MMPGGSRRTRSRCALPSWSGRTPRCDRKWPTCARSLVAAGTSSASTRAATETFEEDDKEEDEKEEEEDGGEMRESKRGRRGGGEKPTNKQKKTNVSTSETRDKGTLLPPVVVRLDGLAV